MNVQDRRRLLGPPNARLLVFGSRQPETADTQTVKPADEIRPMFLKTGLITNANGSAYLEVDNTIISVSVFGPRPIRGSFIDRASFAVEFKFLPYVSQPMEAIFECHNEASKAAASSNLNGRSSLTGIEHKISSFIETSLLPSILLEKYPKSSIDIFVTVIANDAQTNLLNLANWAVNCSSLALVDSGIECKDVVTSGHVRLTANGNAILDPASNSERKAEGVAEAVVSFMNYHNNEIVGIWTESEGALDETNLSSLIEHSKKMSRQIRAAVNSYMLESVHNDD
ncbi:hypothetical protein BABINDRAFT_9777 [Babjeviella inositovora NRRL Y-12698]|uniref:Exoribonuclease phosphorolytic domain-containing protein n=1 Tax=Babjeviella inositovora NRRL Y-12698 TaxID=984486 RepID=A0A1E3QJF3_9ASCO|nr:uncharacterized protein BABINDRAFT_9777 [Babjeviella inositovora NRRL Y-12698]ODQ77790.1 hypothetical protein BABINDRAFT_9777 [Babjeviella inositovora NRRL Y-12698]